MMENPMTSQNPVFIPGPTNMPEVLRKAVDMPTIDHRSPVFGKMWRAVTVRFVRSLVGSGEL